jgi:hypothetical protein
MPHVFDSPMPAEAVTLALAAVLAVLGAVIGYRWWQAGRLSPEERERRRRNLLVERGKMGDATLVEFRDTVVFYSYLVRGVEYTASQDIVLLRERLPAELAIDCAVSIKYDPRNPANSVVLAENWSGLRAAKLTEPRA